MYNVKTDIFPPTRWTSVRDQHILTVTAHQAAEPPPLGTYIVVIVPTATTGSRRPSTKRTPRTSRATALPSSQGTPLAARRHTVSRREQAAPIATAIDSHLAGASEEEEATSVGHARVDCMFSCRLMRRATDVWDHRFNARVRGVEALEPSSVTARQQRVALIFRIHDGPAAPFDPQPQGCTCTHGTKASRVKRRLQAAAAVARTGDRKVRPSRPANTSCGRRELALLPENPPRGRTPTRGAARVLGRDTGFARECLSHLPKPKPNDRVFLTTQLPPRQRIQDPETTQTMKSIPCRRLRAGTTYLQRPRTMPRRASAAHGANGGSKHQRLRWSLGARPRSARSPGRSCQPGVKELA
ncbi:hypothetical protein IEO21_02198 [Rhodonia placenta]|uniref:Uncharacterized protein n=1 Tax=Rhodonia placenta TaxID=104341 RepID=A0A8H7U550_9APHY|nr:hypothetical protein IEO21_02198 [Postia placenta]